MKFFYRDTTETGEWEEISRKKAEDKIAATYGENSAFLMEIELSSPFNCSTQGGQIRAEA